MPLHLLIEQYEKRARAARSAPELFDHTAATARELGFDRLALIHGLWFRRPAGGLIRMDNFGEWADIFIARRYYRFDPVLLAAQRTNRAFPWSEIRRLCGDIPGNSRILGEAQHHGLRVGFSVPVGVLGEPSGCCSFATSASALPPPDYCRAAAWIAQEAFAEARRLHGFPANAEAMPDLSPRALECLRWAAIGRTDQQIAAIMEVKLTTVRTYMAQLRRAFGVCSRTELSRQAQRFGLIDLEDINR